MPSPPRIVISGSFRRHFELIQRIRRELELLGVEILSPEAAELVDPSAEFVILETDDTDDPRTLEDRHLDAIRRADALYVCNEAGYVGASTTLEIGWALAAGIPVFFRSPPEDFTLALYAAEGTEPAALVQALAERRERPEHTLHPAMNLPALQRYMERVVELRGFDDEGAQDIMLLLVEEVGEVAKALRKRVGLKTDTQDQAERALGAELADVLIYLIDLANACDVDLYRAFEAKEHHNAQRTWSA